MKEQLSLTVQARAERGKGANRRLRESKMVPGVYYDDKGTNIAVMVADMPFRKLFKKVGASRVFDLIIQNGQETTTHPSLVWVLKQHPFKNQVEHVDFYGVDPNKEVRVDVAVVIKGKAKGVAVGGKLEIYREAIELTCLPAAIPDEVTVDVSGLDINQHVSVKDIVLPEGVRAIFDQNFAVVGVVAPEAEAEEETAAEA
ncbi:50S ribosomal protein L25/general stress protein Ctc [Fundidesulfovibrio butyratiphilus]